MVATPASFISEDGYGRELANNIITDFANPGRINGLELTFNSVSTVDIETGSARDSSDVDYITLAAMLTLDITVAGAGGLQTGSAEAADTWYEVHVIQDSRGVNADSGLLIPVGTAFSEPGYDRSRRIDSRRNDGSSNFIDFKMTGKGNYRTVMWTNDPANRAVLIGGGATTPTVVDCSSLIPPTSELAHFGLAQNGSPNVNIRLSAGGVAIAQVTRAQLIAGMINVDSSQQIFYDNTTPAGNVDIVVRGYVDEV